MLRSLSCDKAALFARNRLDCRCPHPQLAMVRCLMLCFDSASPSRCCPALSCGSAGRATAISLYLLHTRASCELCGALWSPEESVLQVSKSWLCFSQKMCLHRVFGLCLLPRVDYSQYSLASCRLSFVCSGESIPMVARIWSSTGGWNALQVSMGSCKQRVVLRTHSIV